MEAGHSVPVPRIEAALSLFDHGKGAEAIVLNFIDQSVSSRGHFVAAMEQG